MKRLLVFIVCLLFSLQFVLAYNSFDSENNVLYECGNITEAGVYTLNQSFVANCSGAPVAEGISGSKDRVGCFSIYSDDVVIMGNNFEISNGSCDAGVIEDKDLPNYPYEKFSNITVFDLGFKSFTLPVKIYFSDDNYLFENLNISEIWNNDYFLTTGFVLYLMDNTTVRNSDFYFSNDFGLGDNFFYLRYLRNNILIENNNFYNLNGIAAEFHGDTNILFRNNYFINPGDDAFFMKGWWSTSNDNISIEYNNSFGKIGFYNLNLSFYEEFYPVEESDVNVSNGFLYMNPKIINNKPANGTGEFYSNYKINESIGVLKDGVNCTTCSILDSDNEGIVRFNFTELGNFSVSYTDELVNPYYIDSCKTSGWEANREYILVKDIVADVGEDNCFLFDAKNVTLDGQGYSLSSNQIDANYGVSIGESNVKIKNLQISNFENGVSVESQNVSIENVSVMNSEVGIYVDESFNVSLRNNNFSGNDLNFYVTGDDLNDFVFNIDDSNVIDYDKIWYYRKFISDYEFNSSNTPNAGAVMCINCSNVNITGLNLSSSVESGAFLLNTENIKVNRNVISTNDVGIYSINSTNNSFYGNNVSDNLFGILSWNGKGNNYTYNKILNSENGLILESSSELFYNNLINCSSNVILENILLNNSLGGNYWAYPNGTGFSETCVDSDNKGVCDEIYSLNSNIIDYLPLSSWPSNVFDVVVENISSENSTDSSLDIVPSYSHHSGSAPKVDLGNIENKDFSGVLKFGQRGEFEFKNKSYNIYLRNIDRSSNMAKFYLPSLREVFELEIGKKKKVDLDNDGVFDVFIEFDSFLKDKIAVNLILNKEGRVLDKKMVEKEPVRQVTHKSVDKEWSIEHKFDVALIVVFFVFVGGLYLRKFKKK